MNKSTLKKSFFRFATSLSLISSIPVNAGLVSHSGGVSTYQFALSDFNNFSSYTGGVYTGPPGSIGYTPIPYTYFNNTTIASETQISSSLANTTVTLDSTYTSNTINAGINEFVGYYAAPGGGYTSTSGYFGGYDFGSQLISLQAIGYDGDMPHAGITFDFTSTPNGYVENLNFTVGGVDLQNYSNFGHVSNDRVLISVYDINGSLIPSAGFFTPIVASNPSFSTTAQGYSTLITGNQYGFDDNYDPATSLTFNSGGLAISRLVIDYDPIFSTAVTGIGSCATSTNANASATVAIGNLNFTTQVPEPSQTLLVGLATISLCLRRSKNI